MSSNYCEHGLDPETRECAACAWKAYDETRAQLAAERKSVDALLRHTETLIDTAHSWRTWHATELYISGARAAIEAVRNARMVGSVSDRSEKLGTTIKLAYDIGERVRAAGSIPSGRLYAQVCDLVDIQSYNAVIALLKRSEMVSEHNHIITWLGPAPDPMPT